ncbi:MAG: hypothetical protein LBC51_08810 [Treponema sp.]|nr:hypothetical protein [Treponema sp.]
MESVKNALALLVLALCLGACPSPSAPDPDPGQDPQENSEISLVAIAISHPPNKLVYAKGEDFDPTGLVVTGIYTDNREPSGGEGRAARSHIHNPGGVYRLGLDQHTQPSC